MGCSLGSWLGYGLGSEAQDLPAFLAMIDPGQLPVEGVANWSNGWLPAIYQGTVIRPKEPRILNLQPPAHLAGDIQKSFLEYVRKLNQKHLAARPAQNDLAARIASYQLAARMQSSAREALDISGETKATQEMYGIHETATADYGIRCLIARRLVERGVRFVQLYSGGNENQRSWDGHSDIQGNHSQFAGETDRPVAGLLEDLAQRGLLDETLVVWCGEFGRLPVAQTGKKPGRDHNPHCLTAWMAGGGIKGGHVIGTSDKDGMQPDQQPVPVANLHASFCYALGIDPEKQVQTPLGRPMKLVDNGPELKVQD